MRQARYPYQLTSYPTPREMRDRGEQFCVGTPEECIRFIELYEAPGIDEMILLCASAPQYTRRGSIRCACSANR